MRRLASLHAGAAMDGCDWAMDDGVVSEGFVSGASMSSGEEGGEMEGSSCEEVSTIKAGVGRGFWGSTGETWIGDSDRRSSACWTACSGEMYSGELCSGEMFCGPSSGSGCSSGSGEESKSSMATRRFDFFTFSGFGSDEEGEDLKADVIGAKTPPLGLGSGWIGAMVGSLDCSGERMRNGAGVSSIRRSMSGVTTRIEAAAAFTVGAGRSGIGCAWLADLTAVDLDVSCSFFASARFPGGAFWSLLGCL